MEYKDVKTWDDFEAYISQTPEGKAELDKCQRAVDAVTVAMDRMKELGMELVWFSEDELPDWDEVDKLIYHYEDSDDEEDEDSQSEAITEEERISAAS